MFSVVVCQSQVIRLLTQVSGRLPDIVHLLQPNFDDTAAVIIRQGFAMVSVQYILNRIPIFSRVPGVIEPA